MAIDDNTSYELTGRQVKDLANKVKAKADSASLASVATSGLYSDLTGAPTIPAVYNGTLTIQQDGVTVGTFTANQITDTTVNIETAYEDLMELVRPYDIGDTLTVNGGTIMAGHITSSATQILATLVLPKTISSNVTSVTVDSGGTFTSRGITGYLLATATVGTDITAVTSIPTVRNSIRLTIKNADNSAFDVTNNTPVSTHGNFTITFS